MINNNDNDLHIKKVGEYLYLKDGISKMGTKGPYLYIEDDAIDIMTVKRAFKEACIPNRLDVALNGEIALNYLRDKNSQKPSLIFLDLNMPKMNGIQFMEIVKHDEALRHIPIIILTTSNNEGDKEACFKLSAAGYMVKPMDYRKFVEMIKTIDAYWRFSELPKI